ncbi:MAG: hypothetical protein ABI688_12230 [Bacteroidota bacterium]
MKGIFLPLLSLLIILTTANCKKDSGGTNNITDTPSGINMTFPVPGLIYINGGLLRVEGDMTDLNALATARVEIKNKTTGAVLFQQSDPTTNVTFFRFMWNWTVTGMSAVTPATVKVTAVDKLSHQVSREVDVMLSN